MDLGTLIGLIVALVFVFLAIGSNLPIFIDPDSIMVVFGATVGVTLIKYRLSDILGTIKLAFKAAFFDKSENPDEIVELATKLTKIVQKDGVIALEGQEIKNEFFKKGIDLVMDGHSPEFTEKVLRNEMSNAIEQSDSGVDLLDSVGDSAPAMGMIGTLIGLVIMLQNLDDPASIGPAMAIALITTLYGAGISQLVAFPLAKKLKLRSKDIKDKNELIIQSVLSIQQGQSAIIMGQLLETYLKKPITENKEA